MKLPERARRKVDEIGGVAPKLRYRLCEFCQTELEVDPHEFWCPRVLELPGEVDRSESAGPSESHVPMALEPHPQFTEFLDRALEDPEVRAAYEAAHARFSLRARFDNGELTAVGVVDKELGEDGVIVTHTLEDRTKLLERLRTPIDTSDW